MKRFGLIGGMSWESTQVYYAALNRGVQQRLGGLHSADLLLASVDFAPIAADQAAANWVKLGAQLGEIAQDLERSGAELIMICTNTMHKVAPAVIQKIDAPLLHIGDATGQALTARNAQRVALLGTRFTMADDFYRGHLERHFDLDVMVPSADDQGVIHDIIFNELCQGEFNSASQGRIRAIIDSLVAEGAQAVILGCTELGLLIEPQESPLPILDTTLLHVEFALDAAL